MQPSSSTTASRTNGSSVGHALPAVPANMILAALPAADYQRLLPHLKHVDMPQGEVLQQEGEITQRVYFLSEGMISVVLTSQEGTIVEVGMIGREGVVGIASILGSGRSSNRTMVQIAGKAQQMPAHIFQEEFKHGGRLQEMVLAHIQLMLTDSSQCALCNRLHTVEQRLCRWLLTVRDRTQSDKLGLTQEFIADMLGTRRAGVTVAAGALQEAGLISYKRGCITILDGDGMEEMACECYGAIREQYEQLVRLASQ